MVVPVALTNMTQPPSIYAARSPIAGMGCFAARDFKEGETIGDYTGEIIDQAEADKRYDGREMTYLFDIDNGRYIDGDTDDNPIKYINHSCEGNCESDQDGDHIWIYALRPIVKGEELAYDYNLIAHDDDADPYHCHCKAKSCRGTMKGEHDE
jgi:SET domain-containing protein